MATDAGFIRRDALGRACGFASVGAGAVLLVFWIVMRLSATFVRRVPPAPFFDNFQPWNHPRLVAAHAVIALALLVTGWAVLSQRRFAPLMYVLFGWGGLAFVVAAVWPGPGLRFKFETVLDLARKNHLIPPDGSLLQLAPTWAIVVLALLIVVWLALLVLGTLHIIAAREAYRN